MKKKYFAMVLAAFMSVYSLVGCTAPETPAKKDSNTAASSVEFISKELIEKYGNEPFGYDVASLVELGDITKFDVEITEADYDFKQEDFDALVQDIIDAYIPGIRDDSLTEVGENSIVNIDYVGKLNGEAFKGGTASGARIDVAGDKSRYIEGFTAALIGHKVGDTFDAALKFPEAYNNADLAGKDAVFTMTVNYIYGPANIDTVTNELLITNLGVPNKDEYLKECEKIYEEQRDSNRSSAISAAVIAKVIEQANVKSVPEDLKKSMVDNQFEIYQNYADSYGVSLEEFIEALIGPDVDFVRNQLEEAAQTSLTQEMIMTAAADLLGIVIDEAEFTQFVKDGMTAAKVTDVETFISQNSTDAKSLDGYTNLRTQFRCYKAMQELVSRANVISK